MSIVPYCPRQFVVPPVSGRPKGISLRCVSDRIAASGSLASVWGQKGLWVGRDNARELARNQGFMVMGWGKQ
jgi:hypothetical protein